MESETIRYFTHTGFMKHIKVSKQNPRDFKVGDKYYFCWGGHHVVDSVEIWSCQKEIDELNGNVEKKHDCIDLAFDFWKCVRKVME